MLFEAVDGKNLWTRRYFFKFNIVINKLTCLSLGTQIFEPFLLLQGAISDLFNSFIALF